MPHALPARRLRHGPRTAGRRGRARRPRLPRPRHVLDAGRHARARLLLRLRRAAGHADGPDAGADRARDRQHVGPPPDRAHAARVRRGALRRPDRGRDRAPPRPARSTTTFELVDAITAAIPAPARFAGGHPAKRTFQAIRIAVNDELAQLDEALPLAWELLRPAAAWPRSRSTRSRTGASSASSPTARAAASARPTCPSARAGARPRPSSCSAARSSPTPGEVADNPRSKSARLRAARKLERRSADARRHAQPIATPRARRATPRRAPGPPRRVAGPSPGRRARPAPPRRGTGAFERIRALPDHRVVDRLLRGRAWIWLIGVAARRDRRHAGLAAEAQLRHLARGRDRQRRSSARTPRWRRASRALASGERIRDGADEDGMIDAARRRGRTTCASARGRDAARAARRMRAAERRRRRR